MAEVGPADALRRLGAEGARGIGEHVASLAVLWAELRARPAADEAGRGRLADATRLAHRLAGSGGTFGLPHVSRVAAALEDTLAVFAVPDAAGGEAAMRIDRLIAALHSALLRGPVDALPAADGAAADAGIDDRQLVAVAEHPERPGILTGIVRGLGFAAVPVEGAMQALPPGVAALLLDAGAAAGFARGDHLPGRCPVIRFVDHLDFETRLSAARRGIDVLMETPIEPNELSDWLNSFVSSGAEAPYSVLIVDDDALLADTYAGALRGAGMTVAVTTDPATAPGLIASQLPDLVLMDVQMPGINGIELAQVVRQSRRFLSLPIVFLSAERDDGRQLLARRFGGDDFIAKPVDLGRLAALVRLRAERSRSLRSAMDRDSLTGLLNHGRFKDRLQHELDRCRRTGGEISLAIIDIDRFKKVNDTYGHLAGDRVIRGLARTLVGRLRRTDPVGRYGGEEFAVILPDADASAAFAAIDQVRRFFAARIFEDEGRRFQVTFSAGIASSRRHPEMNRLIATADAMLYEAKNAGRDAVFVDLGPGA